ncbi:MAG: deoxyhypusine synthase [Thermoplasmata archaeon]|uniref:Probable deoxyhypusine synthase n=1 Tax=Candidatus Sysuiplasma superficiale TaxID=2823368 RepID=A0A8J7YQC8_9ARCH|nr:deoxyhypusine synthase [Candidatus Sysuiplasma superficiale]
MKGLRAETVRDMDLGSCKDIHDLTEQMYMSGGFTAKKLGQAVRILERMVEDHAHIFLSFPADIVSTGTRGVLLELIRSGVVSSVITTCGTLDHDIARSWRRYYHGDFNLDDAELRRHGMNRLGNILVPDSSYGKIIESRMQVFLSRIYRSGRRNMSTADLCDDIGRFIGREDSLLYWAHRKHIPVFVPGITDGAVGSQIWLFWQEHRDFSIDLLRDEHRLSDIVFGAKKTGALMIGGGISKHHTIWWNQFRGGLDYAVYLTTAQEFDGSLSGAQTREAISWGKVKPQAKHVTVEGDATITLPILTWSLMCGRRRNGEH